MNQMLQCQRHRVSFDVETDELGGTCFVFGGQPPARLSSSSGCRQTAADAAPSPPCATYRLESSRNFTFATPSGSCPICTRSE